MRRATSRRSPAVGTSQPAPAPLHPAAGNVHHDRATVAGRTGARRRSVVLSLTACWLVAACSSSATPSAPTSTASEPAPIGAPASTGSPGGAGEVTMLAYDAFVEPAALADFTASTGIRVTVARAGDTGTLVNKALLTAGNPEADVLWGVDSVVLSRAVLGGLFEPYRSPELPALDPAAVALVPGNEVTPVDMTDVCINYDTAWFATKGIAAPASFEDLAEPDYRGLLVVENPATSAPGLAFLMGTIAHFGDDGWKPYWEQLVANDVRVADSWDAAFGVEYTAGGGGGTRPIMVSYASSPPAGILFAPDPKPDDPGTGSVEATCFRGYEFAGVLRGADHPDAARQLIDFLVGEAFQAQLPESNFVYPVRTGVALPEVFATFGPPAGDPLTLDPAVIAANRDAWVEEWTRLVIR